MSAYSINPFPVEESEKSRRVLIKFSSNKSQKSARGYTLRSLYQPWRRRKGQRIKGRGGKKEEDGERCLTWLAQGIVSDCTSAPEERKR